MKKGILILAVIIVIGLTWYLFIKPQDYIINAKTNSRLGTINQTLKLWNGTLEAEATISQNGGLEELSQRIRFADSTHQYLWHIRPVTDSTANIKIDVTDLDHSIMNRLQIPFSDTDFEKRARRTVLDFLEKLKEHEESIKVTIVGEEELSSTYCACVTAEGTQFEKATKMMENFPLLNTVLEQNGIALNGVPMIEVTKWNIEKDSIAFNFCYPIIENDSLPTIQNITYRTFEGKTALKAIYNGNYITSDRAWYALLDYADVNGLEVHKTPVEFFFNNPNMGGNELRWKAEVFMPLKQ